MTTTVSTQYRKGRLWKISLRYTSAHPKHSIWRGGGRLVKFYFRRETIGAPWVMVRCSAEDGARI